jgi:hypothetical protein
MENREWIGEFDGTNIVCGDGSVIVVNPNYASRSLLVDGDVLSATFENGRMIYKQLSLADREMKEGHISYDPLGRAVFVANDGKEYNMIAAMQAYHETANGMEEGTSVIAQCGRRICAILSIVPRKKTGFFSGIL